MISSDKHFNFIGEHLPENIDDFGQLDLRDPEYEDLLRMPSGNSDLQRKCQKCGFVQTSESSDASTSKIKNIESSRKAMLEAKLKKQALKYSMRNSIAAPQSKASNSNAAIKVAAAKNLR